MAIIEGWLPPTREHWELTVKLFTFFPLFTAVQWLVDYYPQGKTSVESRLNIPGKIGWMTMEVPGFLTVLYVMWTLPGELGLEGLPWGNWTMAGMFTIHYLYRAIISPWLNPSMSPIHPIVWICAFLFQMFNGISIGGWLGGYGPTSVHDWTGKLYWIEVGLVVWGWSLLGNIYHDDDLREIRRAADRTQKKREAEAAAKADPKDKAAARRGVDKIYMLPKNGLFHFVLYPHYLCEWIEWLGFWMVGGWACAPARNFFVNEVTTMFPRALQGRRWYVQKFGADKVGNRKAIIPGLI